MGYFKPVFAADFAITKITRAIMEKSIIVPTKSPIPKLIPFPTGMVTIAFRQSPPGMNAPGTGMMMSCTRAVTTLPIAAPMMKPIARPITPAFPIKSLNSAMTPFGAGAGGVAFGVTASLISLVLQVYHFLTPCNFCKLSVILFTCKINRISPTYDFNHLIITHIINHYFSFWDFALTCPR